ncbi:MAG: tRNA (adenosine(37)-N6)-threonylcarbamoyltransferase complex ATPase subunit type 1 TsaE [Chlamydiales bacterium]|nr:tRNA (adenosine(37)-N6)-threonylcarbamoyltransferase complex ATPase subunit type 1 TsaE [Chlamydiales bacterium]
MKQNSQTNHCFSLEETFAVAAQFATTLTPNSIVALTGDLGAGKTTFVKGLAEALGCSDIVQSPTYVYLQQYTASIPLFHFDLYRMRTADDFLAMGFDEYFSKEGITLIEWPERISTLLPPTTFHIHIETFNEDSRVISFTEWAS